MLKTLLTIIGIMLYCALLQIYIHANVFHISFQAILMNLPRQLKFLLSQTKLGSRAQLG
jgi:hypothetical protein